MAERFLGKVACLLLLLVQVRFAIYILMKPYNEEVFVSSASLITYTERIPASASNPQSLPDCESKGCVILFFHIVKTGGTSVMFTMHSMGVAYDVPVGKTPYEFDLIEEYLVKGTPDRQPHVYELHAFDNPSFYELREQITTWRQVARANGVGFFTFTLMRKPLPWVVSAFNYICLEVRRCGNVQVSVDDLVKRASINPQCAFLIKAKDTVRIKVRDRVMPGRDDCEEVWTALVDQMDWIGQLEHLDNTFAVVKRLMNVDMEHNMKHVMVSYGNRLHTSDINETTAKLLLDRMAMDTELYQRAGQHYTLSMWSDVF